MNVPEVEKIINQVKSALRVEIEKQNYGSALEIISTCANILYHTNIAYSDDELEDYIGYISKKLPLDLLDVNATDSDTILFWDGFGLNDRGLIQIYLKALCKFKRVVYVTYADRRDFLPDVIRILSDNDAECLYIERTNTSTVQMIEQLNSYILLFKPKSLFFYSTPDDVVALPLMYRYSGIINRYQINLTDHAFWLGAGCCDICINFRNYGAKISKEYRGIEENRNVVIPFYPIIHYGREFQGYPFELKEDNKVVFSGGSLYKTLGEDNKYYHMLDKILHSHDNVVFWYAGNGDASELKKIINKYPGRVFHTDERSDLYQVLKHCDIYLSTYPMCGGLMFQYAAMAGIVPVTLKHGNISDDFLINQEDINIEFENEELLLAEVDRLLVDEAYAKERSKQMKEAVISSDMFEEEVRRLISNEESSFNTKYEHIDTKEFRQWYLDELNQSALNKLFVRKDYKETLIKHFPIKYILGQFAIFVEKVKRHL